MKNVESGGPWQVMNTPIHEMDVPVRENRGRKTSRDNGEMRTVRENKEMVVADLRRVIDDAQNLMNAARTHSLEALTDQANLAKKKVRRGIDGLRDFERKTADQAAEATERTESTIRKHPWAAVGITAVVSMVMGRWMRRG